MWESVPNLIAASLRHLCLKSVFFFKCFFFQKCVSQKGKNWMHFSGKVCQILLPPACATCVSLPDHSNLCRDIFQKNKRMGNCRRCVTLSKANQRKPGSVCLRKVDTGWVRPLVGQQRLQWKALGGWGEAQPGLSRPGAGITLTVDFSEQKRTNIKKKEVKENI